MMDAMAPALSSELPKKPARGGRKRGRMQPAGAGASSSSSSSSASSPASSSAAAGEGAKVSRPQKRFFRQRAHCNPLSRSDGFDYPLSPARMDWAAHFPDATWRARLEAIDAASATAVAASQQRQDVFADVGCGFGGLTVALANIYPEAVSIGFEIRDKVTKYVAQRILHLRDEHPGSYQNVSVMRTNAMRYLPNIFRKAQLTKMFFCFPDPQFKKKKHRRRIISHGLLAEYAYLLRPGVGRLYHITDVPELHEWMASHCRAHPCFEEIDAEEALKDDPAVQCMIDSTEEGKKVTRGGGSKYYAVFRRVLDSDAVITQLE
jgi:tRNA (guanine-N7-)-methyltransferase